MGAEAPIYTLFRIRGKESNCEHHLLLRVIRPRFSKTKQYQEDIANAVVGAGQDALIQRYTKYILTTFCLHQHIVSLVGIFEGCPPGDALYMEHGLNTLSIWTAETKYPLPWVVLGMADSEQDFWHEVEEDRDLTELEPKGPATQVTAFFMTEHDIESSF